MGSTEIAVPEDVRLPVPLLSPRPRMTNPYWVYLMHFDGKESERTMRRCLDRVSLIIDPELDCQFPGETVPWEQLRYPFVAFIRAELQARGDVPWSPSHVNKHLCALRGVAKECWRLGLMNAEDLARIKDVEQVKATRLVTGRNIHADEMAALLAACVADAGPIGVRDAAIVAVLQSTGMRRDEISSLLVERYDPGERALRVIGKGNKERVVHVHPAAVPYLAAWLRMLGKRRGPMFRPIDRHGNIGTGPLNARTVGDIIDRRCEQAGLQPMSTHDFRRTFIGDFLDAGGDLVQAQQIAGHASATTTARYDRRPERARRDAVDRLTLPSIESLTRRGGR